MGFPISAILEIVGLAEHKLLIEIYLVLVINYLIIQQVNG